MSKKSMEYGIKDFITEINMYWWKIEKYPKESNIDQRERNIRKILWKILVNIPTPTFCIFNSLPQTTNSSSAIMNISPIYLWTYRMLLRKSAFDVRRSLHEFFAKLWFTQKELWNCLLRMYSIEFWLEIIVKDYIPWKVKKCEEVEVTKYVSRFEIAWWWKASSLGGEKN